MSKRSASNGGEVGTSLRTQMKQFCLVGAVASDWENRAVVVHPFVMGFEVLQKAKYAPQFRIIPRRHLLATALHWHELLAQNPHLSSADIASNAHVSPGRVGEILRLAKLHTDIQADILRLDRKKAVRKYPEQILRKLTSIPPEQQVEQYARIRPR